ncbi:virginiamycin B lyase [Corallococcus caeni]|uniref:Vgb family protein n=1 Tax=Corallococcus caeni TaxID=3082388 RepID=UPI002957CA2D|nr:virginiamycin B lyase [Corallococcus sp. KH5-1]
MRQPGRLLALALALASLTALAGGTSYGSLSTYGLPSPTSQPLDIVVAPDGNVWFTESSDSWRKVARRDTQGKLTEFPVPEAPSHITVGSDNNIWFTMNTSIGRLTPAGALTVFTPVNQYGLTSFPRDIASGPDGNLWFTMGSYVIKMTTAGAMTWYLVSNPYPPNLQGITAGPDGAMWFADYENNMIGRIDMNGNITQFGPVFVTYDGPANVGAGPDGNVWFTCPFSSTIGRITPTGIITLFPLGGSLGPENLRAGPDGNLWFTEYLGNKLSRMTPDGVVTDVVTVNGADGLARGVGNTLWVTHRDEGKISKFTLAP